MCYMAGRKQAAALRHAIYLSATRQHLLKTSTLLGLSGDLISILITPKNHIITPAIPIINLLYLPIPPNPPSKP